MPKHTKCLLATVSILLATGCVDNPVGFDEKLKEELAAEHTLTLPQAEDHDSDPFRARLEVEFTVEGDLSPDTPITVWLEGVATEKLTGSEVRVLLPTLAEMTYAGEGKRLHYPVDEKLPVAARWTLPPMDAGGRWKRSVSLGRLGKGYYQVSVHVTTEGPGDSPYVSDNAYRQTWLAVLDGGGVLTPGFDASLFPEEIIPQPGPFEVRRRFASARLDAVGGVQPMGATAASSSEDITVMVRYYKGNNVFKPAVGVEMRANYVSQSDERGRPEKQIVPSSGYVQFSCPDDDYEYIEGAGATTTTDEVYGRHGFIPYWEADSDDCGDTISIAGLREVYIPWDLLNQAIPDIDDRFEFDRSRVTFKLNLSTSRSSYNKYSDKITFGTSYDDLWVVGHEYTHALHHRALGGIWYVFLRNCAGHELYKPSGYKCALKEGLADYGGSVSQPSRIRWENKVTKPPRGRGAGEIEGNVAALFHDLFDSNNEGDDEVTYRGRYIMGVFRSCNPGHGSRDDVADIVWCMENRVVDSVHNKHFPGLKSPRSVSEGVTEPDDWDADDIRSTWIQHVG